MKRFIPFTGIINFWTGEKVFRTDKRKLNSQINELISIQSALGQSSQGYKEDYEYRKQLENRRDELFSSIKIALLGTKL